MNRIALTALFLLLPAAAAVRAPGDTDYEADMQQALAGIEEHCLDLLRKKEVDWKKVRKEFSRRARKVKSDQEHYVLLWRLLARMRDGHAAVRKVGAGRDVPEPEEWSQRTGVGMFWCRSGEKILVKNAWNVAAKVGVEPGMEVVEVDGVKIDAWIEDELERLSEDWSFSTPQHAFGFLCHQGLWRAPGTRMKLVLRTAGGKKKTRTLTYKRSTSGAMGPASWPEGLERRGAGPYFGRTPEGFGYVHVRRVPGELPEQLDAVLAELEDCPGLILDFRANSGGGCDHDGLFGRFVPRGRELERAGAYPIPSAGPNPYGGPIVVIVDSSVKSAGETTSGMLKEDGRAYLIGDEPTAGMSSQKTTIELPSGLFELYVSTHSNKGRFNGGRGIEGVGIQPHELVPYQAEDLARGIDTLTRRAVELLEDFPQQQVPYDPARYGWEAKGRR